MTKFSMLGNIRGSTRLNLSPFTFRTRDASSSKLLYHLFQSLLACLKTFLNLENIFVFLKQHDKISGQSILIYVHFNHLLNFHTIICDDLVWNVWKQYLFFEIKKLNLENMFNVLGTVFLGIYLLIFRIILILGCIFLYVRWILKAFW